MTLTLAGGARREQRRRRNICRSALLDASAAALNQNDEHDDKKNAGNNANQGSAVHFKSPFLGNSLSNIPTQPTGRLQKTPGSRRGGYSSLAWAARTAGGAGRAGSARRSAQTALT